MPWEVRLFALRPFTLESPKPKSHKFVCVKFSTFCKMGRCSIVVSIPVCHVGNPGSIPGNGDLLLHSFARAVFFCSVYLIHLSAYHIKCIKYI